ncbi:heterokaryon incompatibility protein [Fusarium pseudocircinatum]|uniref:Heterokaryon incompatibility protein n=1 Tax=Fusarium pseudocircinatum TaxID=56676 RepID=A0A8H5NSX2_9HYPO|nr:heterokaryon incompatibility protein [Fusarium pseudocircinatum]
MSRRKNFDAMDDRKDGDDRADLTPRQKAKNHILDIRKEKGGCSLSNDQDLEAALLDLNTKSTHFLQEMLQNADDCQYTNDEGEVKIHYRQGLLSLEYNENGFTPRDIDALCRVARSSKVGSADQFTGEKGIGFKTVFRVADVVSIASGHYSFQFRKKERLGMITPIWLEEKDFPGRSPPQWTTIVLQILDEYQQEIVEEIRHFSSTWLSFLRRLRKVEIQIESSEHDWKTTHIRNDRPLPPTIGNNGSFHKIMTLTEGRESMTYVLSQFKVQIPSQEEKRPGIQQTTLQLAFPIRPDLTEPYFPNNQSQQLFAYLPIRESGYKFLIQADLNLPNRELLYPILTGKSLADIHADLDRHGVLPLLSEDGMDTSNTHRRRGCHFGGPVVESQQDKPTSENPGTMLRPHGLVHSLQEIFWPESSDTSESVYVDRDIINRDVHPGLRRPGMHVSDSGLADYDTLSQYSGFQPLDQAFQSYHSRARKAARSHSYDDMKEFRKRHRVDPSSDLPHAKVSNPTHKILPARLQLSNSGPIGREGTECTLFAAVDPTAHHDQDEAFVAELLVARILSKHLGNHFNPDVHWTSKLRVLDDREPYNSGNETVATFTFPSCPPLTDFLINMAYGPAEIWKLSGHTPSCHIEVQPTLGGISSPFVLRREKLEMATVQTRKYRVSKNPNAPSNVVALVRVFDLGTGPRASFYIDPWCLLSEGKIQSKMQENYLMVTEPADLDASFNSLDWLGDHKKLLGRVKHFKRSRKSRTGLSLTVLESAPQLHPGEEFQNRKSSKKRGPRPTMKWFATKRLNGLCAGILRLSQKTSIGKSRQWISDMHVPDSHQAYNYRSLKGETRTIRLIELSAGEDGSPLEGVIRHCSLDTDPTYHAISYVWGFDLKVYTIEVGFGDVKEAIRITPSLYSALRRVREKTKSIMLWADAICIDQKNPEEKASQILLMPEIFKAAHSVIAWLGEDSDESVNAINKLVHIAKASRSFSTGNLVSSTEAESYTLKAAGVPAHDDLHWHSINKLLSRRWFRRVWIVQELALARKAIFLCGKESLISWEDLHTAAGICVQEAQKETTGLMKDTVQNAQVLLSLRDLKDKWNKIPQGNDKKGLPLLWLFESFQHTQSTKRRDKLFAFLGLANDSDAQELRLNYDDTLEAIVLRYASVFVQRGHTLDLLYRAEGLLSTRFPSWIPDWTAVSGGKTISDWPSGENGFIAGVRSEGQVNSWFPHKSYEDDRSLFVPGHIIDIIEIRGNADAKSSDAIL